MRYQALLISAVSLIAMSCAGAPAVKTTRAPGADLTKYASFAVAGGTVERSEDFDVTEDAIRGYLDQFISSGMTGKGYTAAEADAADAHVKYVAKVEIEHSKKELKSNRRDTGGTVKDVIRTHVSLELQLVDRASGETVWTGQTNQDVKRQQGVEAKTEKRFGELVEAALGALPSR